MTLGGEAKIRVDNVEVASLGDSGFKVVTLPPGPKEVTVSGGFSSGESIVRFEAKKGEVYRFAIRPRGESDKKSFTIGGPSLQVVKEEGTFVISK